MPHEIPTIPVSGHYGVGKAISKELVGLVRPYTLIVDLARTLQIELTELLRANRSHAGQLLQYSLKINRSVP
jgi:hypothetical protein